MKARLGCLGLDTVGNRTATQCIYQVVFEGSIIGTRARDMSLVLARGNEARQGELLGSRHRGGIEAEFFLVGIHKRQGQNHVGDAKGRTQALGKCVGVDDTRRGVHAHERRNGTARQTELAVVVVLDNVAPRLLACPGKKLVATRNRRDQTRGELVRGHDVGDVCPACPQVGHADATVVERDIGKLGIVCPIDAREARVARRLNRVATLAAKQLHDEVVEHLRPGRHDDLLRSHLHAAEGVQVLGQLNAKGQRALGARVAKQGLLGLATQNLADRFGPAGKGKAVERKRARGEVGDERGTGRGSANGMRGAAQLLCVIRLVGFGKMDRMGEVGGHI